MRTPLPVQRLHRGRRAIAVLAVLCLPSALLQAQEATRAQVTAQAPVQEAVQVPAPAPSQGDDPPVTLRWEVTSIRRESASAEPVSHARFTLRNAGAAPLPSGWTLWFTAIADTATVDAAYPVRRVTGTLFAVDSPRSGAALAPGASVSVAIDHPGEILFAEKGPRGPYLTLAGAPAHGVPVTEFTSIGPRPSTPGMPAGLFTGPEDRYVANLRWSGVDPGDTPPVLPTPRRWRWLGKAGLEAHLARPRLGAGTQAVAGLAQSLSDAAPGEGLPFTVRIEARTHWPSAEAYRLEIRVGSGVTLSAASASGADRGLRTLAQLLGAARRTGGGLRPVEIEDAPRQPVRGLMIDVARNFRSVAEIERVIDAMAALKLNRLHLHLTDDEGWRIEVPALPELTSVGARRGHDAPWLDRLPPAVGSGPDVSDPHASGYYSTDDYVELLRYAAARHIEVIPEIDLPGHARAAIRAMEARHAAHPEEGGRLRLADPADRSEYLSAQGYTDNILNPGLASTDRFVGIVVDALVRMHARAAMPLRQIHIGGDEVPDGAWLHSPVARQRAAQLGARDDAQRKAVLCHDFLGRVLALLDRRGIRAIGWEEMGMRAGDSGGTVDARLAPRHPTMQVWNHYEGDTGLAPRFLAAGYDVLLSPWSTVYLGMLDPPDPADPGWTWSGAEGLQRIFAFDAALPHDPAPATSLAERTVQGPGAGGSSGRILGIEAAIWTEEVRGPGRLEAVVLPELIAVAERAWAPRPAWETMPPGPDRDAASRADWSAFVHRLGEQVLPDLEERIGTLRYRLPAPGARQNGAMFEANYAWPGVALRYTTDGSAPDAGSAAYTGPVPATGSFRVIAVSPDGRRGPETRLEARTP